jgi:hypothetical protein
MISPLQQLVSWVIDAPGGRVHRDLYTKRGTALRLPAAWSERRVWHAQPAVSATATSSSAS